MVVDSSASLRRSNRPHKPNPKYASLANTVEWANTCMDFELLEACAAEAHQHFIPSSGDAHSWEPTPHSIRDILDMPDGVVRRAWLASVKKELKTLFDAGTIVLDTLLDDEISIPVMEKSIVMEVWINQRTIWWYEVTFSASTSLRTNGLLLPPFVHLKCF